MLLLLLVSLLVLLLLLLLLLLLTLAPVVAALRLPASLHTLMPLLLLRMRAVCIPLGEAGSTDPLADERMYCCCCCCLVAAPEALRVALGTENLEFAIGTSVMLL
jgi:hypothetical protein